MKRSKTYKFEALIITISLAIITAKINKLIEIKESENNMDFYIKECLEENILDFNEFEGYPNDKKNLLIRGDVLKEYMLQNNIELIIAGHIYISVEEKTIKIVTYIEKGEEKTIYLDEEQPIDVSNILSIEKVKTIGINRVSKYYNITSTKNLFDITNDFFHEEESNPYKLSLKFNK